MKGFGVASTALAAATCFAASAVAATSADPIVIKVRFSFCIATHVHELTSFAIQGNKFFYKTNGTELYVAHLTFRLYSASTDLHPATSRGLHTNVSFLQHVKPSQILT